MEDLLQLSCESTMKTNLMKITKILKEFVIMKSLFLLTGEADLSDRYELFIIQNINDIYIYIWINRRNTKMDWKKNE